MINFMLGIVSSIILENIKPQTKIPEWSGQPIYLFNNKN